MAGQSAVLRLDRLYSLQDGHEASARVIVIGTLKGVVRSAAQRKASVGNGKPKWSRTPCISFVQTNENCLALTWGKKMGLLSAGTVGGDEWVCTLRSSVRIAATAYPV